MQRQPGAAWLGGEGFLIQGEGADLYEKTATIEEAMRVCAVDERCTSFCANCATRGCAAETKPLTVFFKSYAQPERKIGKQDASAKLHWHSFYQKMVEHCS